MSRIRSRSMSNGSSVHHFNPNITEDLLTMNGYSNNPTPNPNPNPKPNLNVTLTLTLCTNH